MTVIDPFRARSMRIVDALKKPHGLRYPEFTSKQKQLLRRMARDGASTVEMMKRVGFQGGAAAFLLRTNALNIRSPYSRRHFSKNIVR